MQIYFMCHTSTKTNTNRILVRKMLFADDSALVGHTVEDIQVLVDKFADTERSFSLKINIKKTECLYQLVKLVMPPPSPSAMILHDESLVQ